MAANDSTGPASSKSGFAMFTHRMKESLGLAEKTTSNEQVRDLAKKLDTVGEHLKSLMKSVQKMTGCLREMAESGTELGNQLTDASVLFAEDQERIMLSGCSSRTAEFERVMEDTRVKLAAQIDAEVVASMRSILETEIKDCRQQRSLYESSRVDLSNSQTKLATAQKGKQQPKIDAAQADLDAMRKKFEQVEKETLVKLRDGITVAEYKMLDALLAYVEAQKAFYNRGFQMLNASMLDVADYRRHAEETRRKLAAKPQNPKRLTVRMSIAPRSSKKRYFGCSLADLDKEGRCVDGVPIFFLSVIVYIEHWGIEEEGIFRVAGNHNISDAIRAQVEQTGGDYDWGVTGEKLLNATDLMKQFLRELPTPLLSPEFCSAALAMKPSPEPSQNVAFVTNLLDLLPISAQRILKLLFMLLHKVSQVKINRMSPVALATCMGPNLTSMNFGPDVDPFEQTAQLNGLVSFMIQNAEAIFEKVRSAPSPPASPRIEQTTPVASSSVPASPRTPASPRSVPKAMVNPGLEPQVTSPVPAEPVAESSGSP